MDAPNGFQYALETTSPPGLAIVIALGFLSVLTWSVLLTKFQVLRQAKRRNTEYLEMFRRMRHPLEIYEKGLDRRGTPLYSVYAAGSRELCLQMLGTSERDESFSLRLRNAEMIAPTQVQAITLSMERAIGEMAVRLEEKMSLLATCVSGAPFLGLLGTVWGVMDTFAAVASSSSGASIQDMAPGVSGALVTTVVGLLIAIPAMFGYNYLIQEIKNMVMLLDHHASELGAAYERHYVDHGPAREAKTPPPSLGSGPVPVTPQAQHGPPDPEDLLEDADDEHDAAPAQPATSPADREDADDSPAPGHAAVPAPSVGMTAPANSPILGIPLRRATPIQRPPSQTPAAAPATPPPTTP